MNSILVRNIKHLTDARYFAAMGVDWMSIELNAYPGSFLLWHTLRDWVEGVKLAAEIPADDEMLLAKTIIEALPDGIILNQPLFPEVTKSIQLFYETDTINILKLSGDDIFILPYEADLTGFGKTPELPVDRIFLQSSWTMYSLKTLLDSGYEGGICFSGGEEDKTGIRDYELMDDLFNVLSHYMD